MASGSTRVDDQGEAEGAVAAKFSNSKNEPIRSCDVTKSIRPTTSEGVIQLAGCSLFIPDKALSEEKKLTMKMLVVKRSKYVLDDMMLFGPELHFGPDGTKFSKSVTASVPTCYAAVKGNAVVEVQTKESSHDKWQDCQTLSVTEKGNIEFTLHHFSLYRFLMRMLGIEKSIADMSFTRQNDENEYEMIWCFCDNLRETRLEVQKEMAMQDFNLTKTTETFAMSSTDNIRVALNIAECEIEDPVQTISADDLWFSDSVVKLEFIIRHLQGGKKINYKLERVKSGNVQQPAARKSGFIFQPKTGRMDRSGGNVVFMKPEINNMSVG